MAKKTLRRASLLILNASILYFITLIIALIVTGGYQFELSGMTFSSNRIDPLVSGLMVAGAIRLALHLGPGNSALLFASCFLAIGLAEVCVRVLSPAMAAPGLVQIHQPSDVYGFELVPGSVGHGVSGEYISINPQGARDAPFDDKRSGTRIVAVGDSFTFGIGVELEDSYVKQLESNLRVANRNVEVLNLGVASYNFWHYLEVLDNRVAELQPDLVVIGFYLDDLSAPVRPSTVTAHNPFEQRAAGDFNASRLWNLIRNLWTRFEARYRYRRGYEYLAGIEQRKNYIGGQNPDHIFYRLQTGSMDPAVYRAFSRAVDRLAAWSVREGVPVVVVFIPDASQIREPLRQSVNRTVAAEMARAGIPFVDATPIFEAQPDARPLYLFPLDAHTSPSGHLLIARVLAENATVRKLVE
ncbi:MAG: GDSL-type esterase/lipase family protein [Gammaproteobacteria bacterium]|nr:GDSL-type esterase/lipase family protein [Gammaproteobacteria bacterium]